MRKGAGVHDMGAKEEAVLYRCGTADEVGHHFLLCMCGGEDLYCSIITVHTMLLCIVRVRQAQRHLHLFVRTQKSLPA